MSPFGGGGGGGGVGGEGCYSLTPMAPYNYSLDAPTKINYGIPSLFVRMNVWEILSSQHCSETSLGYCDITNKYYC